MLGATKRELVKEMRHGCHASRFTRLMNERIGIGNRNREKKQGMGNRNREWEQGIGNRE